MNKKRPINLDLSTINFPPMAIASILHRISGILLFVLLPVILCLLQRSLFSSEAFLETQMLLTSSHFYKLILWIFGGSMIYHVLAGIRHMLMDIGLGEELHTGKYTAILVLVLAAILIILLGIWIW